MTMNGKERHVTGINDLPCELLGRIFKYFHPVFDHLPGLSGVCRYWRDVLHMSSFLWRDFLIDPTFYDFTHFSTVATIIRTYGYHIRRLTWKENTLVYEAIFSIIPRLHNLTVLRLPVLWTRWVISTLSPLIALEEIQINGGFSITDFDLMTIATAFPRLRRVSFNACWCTTRTGVQLFLEQLMNCEALKFKINSGLPTDDVRSVSAKSAGLECIQWAAESAYSRLVTVLCLHFVDVEMEQLWNIVNGLTRLKKLSVSNCEHLHGVRLESDSLQKMCLCNLPYALFVSVRGSCLRHVTIDCGLESLEHLELDSPKLRRVTADGGNVLRTLTIRSKKLVYLELIGCGEIDADTLRTTLKNNSTIICLRIGSLSQESLTLDENIIPNLQEFCLLNDFACQTLHLRGPSLRLIHTICENDISSLSHVYVVANHLCKVTLVGIPALRTMTIQCVSVDSIELNLCSDDQLVLEACIVQAMGSIGFLRLFDCRVNLLSVTTPLARTVVLYRCQLSDYVLRMALDGCVNISHLNIEKCVDLRQIDITSSLLRYLNMFGCNGLLSLNLKCPRLTALNLGHCPLVRLYIDSVRQQLEEFSGLVKLVLPSQSIRWSHDYPPQIYNSPR